MERRGAPPDNTPLDACPSYKAVSLLLFTDKLKFKGQCTCHPLRKGFPDKAFPKALPVPLQGVLHLQLPAWPRSHGPGVFFSYLDPQGVTFTFPSSQSPPHQSPNPLHSVPTTTLTPSVTSNPLLDKMIVLLSRLCQEQEVCDRSVFSRVLSSVPGLCSVITGWFETISIASYSFFLVANISLEAPWRFSSVKAAIASMTFWDLFQPIPRMVHTGLVEQPWDWAFPRWAKSSCPFYSVLLPRPLIESVCYVKLHLPCLISSSQQYQEAGLLPSCFINEELEGYRG